MIFWSWKSLQNKQHCKNSLITEAIKAFWPTMEKKRDDYLLVEYCFVRARYKNKLWGNYTLISQTVHSHKVLLSWTHTLIFNFFQSTSAWLHDSLLFLLLTPPPSIFFFQFYWKQLRISVIIRYFISSTLQLKAKRKQSHKAASQKKKSKNKKKFTKKLHTSSYHPLLSDLLRLLAIYRIYWLYNGIENLEIKREWIPEGILHNSLVLLNNSKKSTYRYEKIAISLELMYLSIVLFSYSFFALILDQSRYRDHQLRSNILWEIYILIQSRYEITFSSLGRLPLYISSKLT